MGQRVNAAKNATHTLMSSLMNIMNYSSSADCNWHTSRSHGQARLMETVAIGAHAAERLPDEYQDAWKATLIA